MASYPKNYPFYNWVPKPLGILILLFLFLPILTVGGVYSSNVGEMVGGLGIISEHIQFATFATSIGMAAFAPFFYRLVCIRREKDDVSGRICDSLSVELCLRKDRQHFPAGSQQFCDGICAYGADDDQSVYAYQVRFQHGSYPQHHSGLEPKDEEGWDKLDVEKSSSQPMIYLFFMILGQMGTWLTAWLAYEYEWQYVYYYMMGMVLVSILLVFFTMPYHNYVGQRFPINFRKFANVVVFSVFFLCIVYVLIYGKTLDWYSDSSVCWATAVAVLTGVLGIYLERMRGSHFPVRYFQAAYRENRNRAVPVADDSQFQFHAGECIYGCRHENRQLAECHARQLVSGRLCHWGNSGNSASQQRRAFQVSVRFGIPVYRIFSPVHVFRSADRRTV